MWSPGSTLEGKTLSWKQKKNKHTHAHTELHCRAPSASSPLSIHIQYQEIYIQAKSSCWRERKVLWRREGKGKKSLQFLGLWSAGWMHSVELGQSIGYYIHLNIWIPAQGSRVCGSHLCCISIEYQTTFSAFWIIKLNSLRLPYGLLLKYFQTLAAVLFLKERFLSSSSFTFLKDSCSKSLIY